MEWPPETYSVLSNVLLDNNIKSLTVLFRFSDMVEAIAHFPCTNIIVPPNRNLRGYNCILTIEYIVSSIDGFFKNYTEFF